MLGRVGIRAREQHAPAREVRDRRPHLLAVHDPVVAVAHRARRETGHVGAGARLAEHLAPDLLAREDLRQQALLLLLAGVGEHHGRAHADADDARGRIAVHDLRVARDLVVHDQVHLRRQPEPAVALPGNAPRRARARIGPCGTRCCRCVRGGSPRAARACARAARPRSSCGIRPTGVPPDARDRSGGASPDHGRAPIIRARVDPGKPAQRGLSAIPTPARSAGSTASRSSRRRPRRPCPARRRRPECSGPRDAAPARPPR